MLNDNHGNQKELSISFFYRLQAYFKKIFLNRSLFSIKKGEWLVFGSMFFIVALVNMNFNVLRSMRNTLVVADAGGSATFIPYFELFGTFPASILLTWALSRLMRFCSFRRVFSITMLFFLLFFLLFSFGIYPYKNEIHSVLEGKLGNFSHFKQFKVIITHWPDMVFYIMSELWKVALISVIFWGFLNQKLSLEQAKRFYPPLLLGSSVGTILAGPVTVFCTSLFSWNLLNLSDQRWQHSLYLLTIFLITCGLITLILFDFLFKRLEPAQPVSDKSFQEVKKEPFSKKLLSLTSSLRYCMQSRYLSSLLLIVTAEYICYALGELIFLETLKSKYPSPSEYCQYMGSLSFWMGMMTAFSALFLTPYLLQRYRWSKSIIITPFLMMAITFAFFFVIFCGNQGAIFGIAPLTIAVAIGSLHFCVCRATKYTMFDAIKELAFIPLNDEAQMKGKLIIDGIGSRMGRGGSSLISIILFLALGGPAESAIFIGILAIAISAISIPAARYIGREMEESNSVVAP